ncbi:unnamed protein product [Strongylus vulgaris]|uniref:Uncharacterized protein n=1 Tax=Strongylus vulgaris TaxID=40348 RepID=A0A3P7J8H6_STRVU|nr:unnamed protein product [Strongylus vulgaris]
MDILIVKKFRAWTDIRSLDEWEKDVDTIIELFTDAEKPVNFVAWYVAEPDHTLHHNGYYNGEYEKTLSRLDNLFGYFLSRLDDSGFADEINVILTADHGHIQHSIIDLWWSAKQEHLCDVD